MSVSHPCVLIVDDEPDMLWVLGKILQYASYRVTTASTAKDALSRVQQERFDMAFIDMKLPDMSGQQLTVAIRTVAPDLPIAMISGYYYTEDPEIQRELQQKPYTTFIAKPFDSKAVQNVVQQMLAR